MGSHTAVDPDGRRGVARRIKVALALGPLVAASWVGAHAAFTDSVDAQTTFSAGTVDLKVNASDTTVAFTSLALTNATPGSTSYGLLTVSNGGTAPFTYGLGTTITGSAPLAAALVVGVKTITGATCDATAYTGGTVVYADTASLTAATFSSRALAVGGSEKLCFKVQLPSGASNTLQGTSTTATFTFSASG